MSLACKSDRYVSFKNIDCVGNARRLMSMLYRHIDDPAKNNRYWDKFRQARAGNGHTPPPDDLLLIHSHINQIRVVFETYADEEALTLLDQFEEECC